MSDDEPPDEVSDATNGSEILVRNVQSRSTSHSTESSKPRTNFHDYSIEQRKQMELMFTMQTNFMLGGSWKATEAYVKIKDDMMCEYILSFPTKDWLSGSEAGYVAYQAMLERDKLRKKGQRIYTNGRQNWQPIKETQQLQVTDRPPASRPSMNLSQPAMASSIPDWATNPAFLEHMPIIAGRVAHMQGHNLLKPSWPTPMAQIPPPPQISNPHVSTRARGSKVKEWPPTGGSLPKPKITLLGKSRATAQVVAESDMPYTLPVEQVVGTSLRAKRSSTARKSMSMLDSQSDLTSGPRSRQIPKTPTGHGTSPPPYGLDDNASVSKNGLPDFPWHAGHSADDPFAWDDSIYPQHRLDDLNRIQADNHDHVHDYMTTKQSVTKGRRPSKALLVEEEAEDPDNDDVDAVVSSKTSMKRKRVDDKAPKMRKLRIADGRDNNLAGRLRFVDRANERRCADAGFFSIATAIDAAMQDPFNADLMTVMVINDPGDSLLAGLEVPHLSIMDVARTRLQLQSLTTLPDLAAWRLIDFCPDMLMTYRLLQLIGETSASNTTIQQRLGYNGNMISDSTITKRVTAALAKEHDKIGAAAALKQDVNYKVANRNIFNKYKAFHAARRESGIEVQRTFDLRATADAYKAQRAAKREQEAEAELDDEEDTVIVRPKRKKRRTSKRDPSDDSELTELMSE